MLHPGRRRGGSIVYPGFTGHELEIQPGWDTWLSQGSMYTHNLYTLTHTLEQLIIANPKQTAFGRWKETAGLGINPMQINSTAVELSPHTIIHFDQYYFLTQEFPKDCLDGYQL